MNTRVALRHTTVYRYDRPVSLSPHDIRLRPAPHGTALILAYALTVQPGLPAVRWQADAFGNLVARVRVPGRTTHLEIAVDLVAELAPADPFDFVLEPDAATFPPVYAPRLRRDLAPYLAPEEDDPLLDAWLAAFRAEHAKAHPGTVATLVELNGKLCRDLHYETRVTPGVQSCRETLATRRGSCRDSAWLLVEMARHLGLAARFVSGYLIQLAQEGDPDAKPDRADLHAWAEVFLPGAGWIGFDPTSGLATAEGHLPLACAPSPADTAAVSGRTDPAHTTFDFSLSVARVPV
jgi:transglutaminase-like putative cysteine protease